ncbi:MAG: metallophosphoesterase [Verrucomicrobiaceae bacterium]|nr:metallophosphoesterase [Verrucomicrobiaceae bacterium]
MNTQPYDLIGDIHGQYGKLVALLTRLGYRTHGGTWRHPEGRKVIFLGDYIDRGPAVRETLHTVRGMVNAGDAQAIMGNHEFNAVCWHTPDRNGGWLRKHTSERDGGHRTTLAQFAGLDAEWQEWMEWMKHLPMTLDLGKLRAVHASWDEAAITIIGGRDIRADDFLHLSATQGTPEFYAVETLLKGPEIDMPPGHFFADKEGIARRKVRVRWWDIPEAAQVSRLAMPEPFDVPGDAAPHDLRRIPDYGVDEPPVFFGHYWLPPSRERAPLAPNIACLDYSAAFGDNALTAYRWDGEQVLSAEKFVTTTSTTS